MVGLGLISRLWGVSEIFIYSRAGYKILFDWNSVKFEQKNNKMYKNTKQINVTFNESWLQIFKLILFWGFIIPGTIERKLRNSKLGSTSFSGKKPNDISKFAVLFSGWEKPVREEYLVSPVPSLSWLNVIRFPMKMMTAASRFTFLWGRESPWGSRLCWMTLYLRYLLVVVGRTVNFPRD